MPDPTSSDVHIPSTSTGVLGLSPPANAPTPQPPMTAYRDGKWYVAWRGKEYGPYATHSAALHAAWAKLGMKELVTKNADTSGCMAAFRLPQSIAEALVSLGNEDIEQLHITVIYVGDESNLPDKSMFDRIIGDFARAHSPLTATITGFGIFSNNDSPVLVALVSIPGSTEFRAKLMSDIRDVGINPPENYGWLPHITLEYGVDATRSLPEIPPLARAPFTLDWLMASVGDESTEFPLLK